MHALIDMTESVLSLTGPLRIDYPSTVWTSVDWQDAALQDLFGNEPWFLLEGWLTPPSAGPAQTLLALVESRHLLGRPSAR